MTAPDDSAAPGGGRVGPVGRARASLRAIEALDRVGQGSPSAADLDELRGWSGWGPMAAAFAQDRSGSWKQIGERLEWLLPPGQLQEARQATPNAFYTPPGIAAACWQILRDLGFTGGAILEPGCGAGAFMAATPAGVPVAWTGVERDPVTARIAALLHPSATIHCQRMQNAGLPAHSMDAVLGNVPFGEVAVYDPTAPRAVTKSLHNYCIWRSVRTLKPGGVAVLLTSRFTLDAREPAARQAIAGEADLLAAIRLPGKALSPGGTEVIADILVLRSRSDGTAPADQNWIETAELREVHPELAWGYDDRISQWFVTSPHLVLGELQADRAAAYGRTVKVHRPDDAEPIDRALASAAGPIITQARARGFWWNPPPAIPVAGDLGVHERADGRRERSFHLLGGAVHQVEEGLLLPVDARGKQLAELTALIRLRDAAVGLLDAETHYERGEEDLAPLRARLNTAYDRYAAAYGPLNRATITAGDPDPETGLATFTRRRPRMGGFRQDPDYATVLALENYDDETGHAAKAAIFTRRVNVRPERPDHAETPAEAIRICLDAHGRLDLPVIGGLLGIPAGQVPAQLGGLAYLDPVSGKWVTAEEYLSGDVRVKLADARAAAGRAGDGPAVWPANVAALEKVQPSDLGPDEIRAKLGAPWIPSGDIRAFAAETLGYAPAVRYLPVIAQWEVKVEQVRTDTAAATDEWGTGRIDGYRLLELALNGRAPVVYDTVTNPDGSDTRVRNQAETMLAEEKQRALATRFGEWAWEDPQRCDRLCAEYNRRFNAVVLRRYDGSHLTFPGLAAGFTPYPHQADMVHRIITAPASLCPYPVGTGKTPVMFMAARKLKELGLAAKPLIIVPNHLLEQTAREGKRLFPSARILIAAREDVASSHGRELFAARCATGDWDAVVMTHSAFTALPVHPATQAAHLTALAAKYRQVLTAERGSKGRTVKQLAKMVDAFETRARTLLEHRTADSVWFEHLGCDLIMADEAHYFKNLGLPVRTDGFSVAASKRATDLDMKLALIRERGGARVAALFTGTPVSNSLLEMYVLQHYLHPQRLEQVGLPSADAWAATFVQFASAVEVTPDGSGFRLKRRPAKFENVPELLTLFGEVADLRPPDSFAVQRPAARHHAVVISPSAELRDYVAGLAARADKVGQADKHDDNMLKICSDGRKAALDLELVGVSTRRAGKVGAVIANVARIYHENFGLALPGDIPAGRGGGFQIVFCDLGTPGAHGSQVYGKIRAGLIAAGVPAADIRFVHDAATDLAKSALFADCRAGKVAVLLGSTDKLGVGTNIQTRCLALHHVDAPWRPADVEQREGRALRPGNLNPVVDLYRYVSEKSFDSFMWQALERKARFIGQVLSGRPGGRDVDDIGDATLSYAEVKALATGNPLLLELAEASADVTRLRQLAAGHTRATRRLTQSVAGWEQQITAKSKLAADCDLITAAAREGASLGWTSQDRVPIPADDVAGHLAHLATRVIESDDGYRTARWRGLTIAFHASRQWRQITAVATIYAGDARLTTELNPAWTSKGQHWRIEKEITALTSNAAGTAERLRGEIDDLRQRIADANRRIGEPFPHAAELEAARTRRDAIDQAIRDAAAPQDNADAESADVPDLPVEMDGPEEVTIISVSTWAETSAAEDVSPDKQVLVVAPVPAPGERAAFAGEPSPQVAPGDIGSDESRSPLRAIHHPAYLASLDYTAEPLFPLPEATTKAPATSRPKARRQPRRARRPPNSAAPDLQEALFDLPAPASVRPAASRSPAARRK